MLMTISSPFLVVPVIFGTFLCCILFATGGKPEGPDSGKSHH